MARTSPFHWIGVIFIFIAAVLLLITTISAPVIGDIAILKVTLSNSSDIRHSSVTFGTFGHCVLDVAPAKTDQDYCYPKSIGYKPADIMKTIDGTVFGKAAADSVDGLTNVMILHPIACAIAFLACPLSMGAGVIGSIFGALVAFVAWALTVAVMAIDFTLFGTVKDHVNEQNKGSHAYYSVGMWTCLAAMVLLFLGMFIVLFTCFSARKKKRKSSVGKYGHDETGTNGGVGYAGYATPQTGWRARRNRWF